MTVFKNNRRIVNWQENNSGVVFYTGLVAAAPVRSSWRPDDRNNANLLLLGVGERGRPWPEELWLTDLTEAQPGALFRMTRLLDRVKRNAEQIGNAVGLKDFTGRSFGGSHRHTTLASVAYAVTALADEAMPEGHMCFP
jgi:hypothetical protein